MRKILAAFVYLTLASAAHAQLVLPSSGGGGGSTTPGGANTNVQFNSGGSSFGGDAGFTYSGLAGNSTAFISGSTTVGGSLTVSNVGSFGAPGIELGVFDGFYNTTNNHNIFYAQFGNSDYVEMGAVGFRLNSGSPIGFANGDAANAFDTAMSRGSANVIDFGNGTQADSSATIQAAHASFNALANSATTSAVCYNTTTGVLTFDATVGTCNTSSERFKHNIRPLEMSADALRTVMAWHVDSFFYNSDQHTDGEQVGLIAENLASTDRRLVAYDNSGEPSSLRVFAIIGYLVAAIQQQQHEIDELKKGR